ncbi:MAG: helix-turn-helix transcriptional regulator [Bifidobacteriaceae bacterium]|nr:helix-turn-helix transcriptional regulator [Bifidobacteriaceae bacterium]
MAHTIFSAEPPPPPSPLPAEPWEVRFGDRVRTLRLDRGWTQEEFGKRLGQAGHPMSQPIVANLEAGKRPTRVAEIVAIAAVFAVPIAGLFGPPTPTEDAALAVAKVAEATDQAVWAFTRAISVARQSHAALRAEYERLAAAIDQAGAAEDPQVAAALKHARGVLKAAQGTHGQTYTVGGPASTLTWSTPGGADGQRP